MPEVINLLALWKGIGFGVAFFSATVKFSLKTYCDERAVGTTFIQDGDI